MSENILLYFSDTGRGHRSATEAIEDALKIVARKEFGGKDINIIAEPVAEKSHPLNRFFVEVYNYFLRDAQYLMKYYYELVHWLKPNEGEYGYRLVRDYLCQQMIDHKPSVVVSIHPMTNHFVARAMKDVGLTGDVKFIVVVTDPNKFLWKGWACPDADIIVCPNDLVREQLLEWGIRSDQIKTIGMPVHPDFLASPTSPRSEFLSHLGLDPERPTLCINAGWAGGGNMLQAYRALDGSLQKLQVIFLCGHNMKLYEQAREQAKRSRTPTAVLPFHDSMPDIMSAADAMVTKAGGLTTFECVARRLPMIIDMITQPMPQESGTVDFLVEQGLASAMRSPEELVALVRDLHHDENRMSRPLPAAHNLNRVGAALEIARLILSHGTGSTTVPEQSSPEMLERRQIRESDMPPGRSSAS